MTLEKLVTTLVDIPRLVVRQGGQPVRLAFRKPQPYPDSQQRLAALVDHALTNQIRAGYTHRFIDLMFVTVGDRVFCRRYQYNEPSWHSMFLKDPRGQIKLDKTIINIEARAPDDLGDVVPDIDAAYASKLKMLGARFLLDGAIDRRAQESTLELILADSDANKVTEGLN